MASTASASFALFLAVSLLFFVPTGAACRTCSAPAPKAPHNPKTTLTSGGECPINAHKLAVCGGVLDGLITIGFGELPKQPCECCSLLDGLLDLEAAVCLCTAFKASIFGIKLNIPINHSLLLNYCGKTAPVEFQCPY